MLYLFFTFKTDRVEGNIWSKNSSWGTSTYITWPTNTRVTVSSGILVTCPLFFYAGGTLTILNLCPKALRWFWIISNGKIYPRSKMENNWQDPGPMSCINSLENETPTSLFLLNISFFKVLAQFTFSSCRAKHCYLIGQKPTNYQPVQVRVLCGDPILHKKGQTHQRWQHE